MRLFCFVNSNMKNLYISIYFISIIFAQWEQLEVPLGGQIRSIYSDEDLVYTASSGGVLVKNSQENIWSLRNEGLESCDTKSLAKLGDYMFVSTDENVFRSNNQGLNWEKCGSELEGIYVKNLITINNVIFAATYLKGIYKSTDFGESWTAINNGFSSNYPYYFETDGANLFCGTYLDGMFRSSDMGQNWEQLDNGLDAESIIAVFSANDKLFASSLNSDFFLSYDSGDTWEQTNFGMSLIFSFAELNGQLFASSLFQGIYVSNDNGETWINFNSGLGELNVRTIGVSENAVYAGMTSGNIYRYNFEQNIWEITVLPALYSCVGSICSTNSILHIGTHGNKNFASSNSGDTWYQPSGIGTVEVRSLISSNGYIFAGTDMLGVFKSSINGSSFSSSSNGLSSYWINDFAFCNGNLYAGSGNGGVYLSTNLGESWNPINNMLTSLDVLSLACDDENIYAITDLGINSAQISDWNWNESNYEFQTNDITVIDYNYENNFLLIGTKNNGVYISHNQGQSWLTFSNGLPESSYIREIYSFNDKSFLSTNQGEIFILFNNSNQWINITNNFLGAPVLSLHIADDFIYAGVNAGGVWRSLIPELGDLNFDAIFNVQDILLIIDLIINNEYYGIGDMNLDETIDVLDIVQLVNIILN